MKFRVLVDATQRFFEEFEEALEYAMNAEGDVSLAEWDWKKQVWRNEALPCIAV